MTFVAHFLRVGCALSAAMAVACADTYPEQSVDYRSATFVVQQQVVFHTGQAETQEVWIGNLGPDSAQIEQVTFYRGADRFAYSGLEGLQLAPGEEGSFLVTYTPALVGETPGGSAPAGRVTGRIELRWTTPEREDQHADVMLVANRVEDGQLELSAPNLEFGAIEQGSTSIERLRVRNRGSRPVTLNAIEFADDPGELELDGWVLDSRGGTAVYSASPPDQPSDGFAVDSDSQLEFPLTIDVQQQLEIPIRFSPPGPERRRARMRLVFDGAPASNVDYTSIIVSGGTGPTPCLRIDDGAQLDFGSVPSGETAVLRRTLRGCYAGEEISRVARIYLVGTATAALSDAFALSVLEPPAPPTADPEPPLRPPLAELELSYTAEAPSSEQAAFLCVDMELPARAGRCFEVSARSE